FVAVEGSDNNILGVGYSSGSKVARLVYRPTKTGTYRIIAIAGGNLKTVTCSLSVRLLSGAKGVPSWFHDLDTNRDGQVSISEWRKSGRKIADFRKYDLNCDGFISPGEALQMVKKASQLELKNGKAEYKGTIEEEIEARYQGRKSFKIFTIKM